MAVVFITFYCFDACFVRIFVGKKFCFYGRIIVGTIDECIAC